MDFSKFDNLSEDLSEKMELRYPDGLPMYKSDGVTPVTLSLISQDSESMQKARHASLNAASKRRHTTSELVLADSIRLMAKATVGWDGVGIGEDETAFSFENAVRLYTKYPFIREQVDAFITERVNFFKGGA